MPSVRSFASHLEHAGVDAAGVATTPGSSGVATIIVANHGRETASSSLRAQMHGSRPTTSTRISPFFARRASSSPSFEIPLETVEHLAKICAREGIPLILDPAPAKQLAPSLLQQSHGSLPTKIEAAFFTGQNNGSSEMHDPSTLQKALIDRGIRESSSSSAQRGASFASKDSLEND